MNLVKSSMWWPCWSFSWASIIEWTAIWKQLHETNDEHIQQRENSIQHFYFQHALIHGCMWFNSGKVTSLLERTWRIILRDSGFTRLTMSIDNKERLKFSTFISNMRSFMAAYDLIQANKYILLGKSDGLSYVTPWVHLCFLEPSCISCIAGIYLIHPICALMAVMLNKVY